MTSSSEVLRMLSNPTLKNILKRVGVCGWGEGGGGVCTITKVKSSKRIEELKTEWFTP